jgi:MFS family permease
MLRSFLHQLLSPRHPWRKVNFSELSEMYIAGFLKMFAQGLIGVFIPLYLLKNGFALQAIFIYYAVLYMFTILFDLVSARLTARFGPKHVMRLGFFLQFVVAILLSQLHILPAPLLIIPFVHAASAAFYWLPYHVDFSKIKHVHHSGKEISWLNAMEKVGGVLGPLVGGLLATFFGGVTLFYAAALVLAIAVIVLMLSPEPMQTKQKLSYAHLFTLKDWRATVSNTAFITENSLSILLWPIFLASVVFTTEAYLKIGSIASISVVFAMFAALPLGRLLDKTKGYKMIRFGTVINSLLHVSRLLVTNYTGAALVAVANEPNTLIYRLAYLKGYYDSADDFPGQRIAYIARNEMVAHSFCLIIWTTLALLAGALSAHTVCMVGFGMAAVLSLIVRTERYRALR